MRPVTLINHRRKRILSVLANRPDGMLRREIALVVPTSDDTLCKDLRKLRKLGLIGASAAGGSLTRWALADNAAAVAAEHKRAIEKRKNVDPIISERQRRGAATRKANALAREMGETPPEHAWLSDESGDEPVQVIRPAGTWRAEGIAAQSWCPA